MENILSILIWLPVVGMVAIAFIPREKEELIRITAAVTTGIQFLFTLFLWGDFDSFWDDFGMVFGIILG